ISFENNSLISTTFGGSPANSHWGVLSWELGVTEPGSSGSPLFNQNRRIIGQLHGGASACGASVLSDEYGKVSVSWNPAGSTSSGQLKYWLDPNNSNASFVDGYDPSNAPTITLDAGLSNSTFIQTSLCGSNYIPNVTISNGGSQTVTTAVISYSIDGGTAQNYNWNGSLAQFQTQVINLPPVQLLPGNHTFSATVSQVNNGVDELTVNNATNTQFLVTAINQTSDLLKVTLLTDDYSSETYMELLSSNGTVVWFQGNESFAGTYGTNNTPGPTDPTSPLLDNTTYNWDVPLSLNDCYTFKIYDYYGDGLSGFIADGSLSLANHNNINFYTLSTPNFGAELGIVFKNISTIGIVESENQELNVFPNPANDLLYINLPSSSKQISIVDIYGKLIYSEPALFESHELKISSLATVENLILWKEQGINRLSIGLQSFKESDLTWMNRSHNVAEGIKSVKLAQSFGFKNISVDIMYGLPNLSSKEWKEHLQSVLALNVTHISAYCLTIEPKTALFQEVKKKKILPVNDEVQSRQFEEMIEFLAINGYEQYEISNFARDEQYSKHNSNYWKGVPFLGIGPSAHSFDGTYRRWNISNNTKYYKNVGLNDSWYEEELLSIEDQWNELFLTGLRTKWGVSKEKISLLGGFSEEEEKCINNYILGGEILETSTVFLLTK
ncbi:MAG: hypothetical protein EBR41_03885, partial [Crocinitomicaceae bacterium]|nr:hypothetical protein [Crocinitomicaceae bacterium]